MEGARPISGIERAWLAASAQHPPFAIAVCVEAAAVGVPDLAAWTDAVRVAAAASPGARAVWRGALCRARWEPLVEPAVREVDGTEWSGMDPSGAPFLDVPLDPVRGPTAELLVVRGNPARLVFRVLHATMDGAGAVAFLRDVFRARRGEAPLGHDDVRTDLDLAAGDGTSGPPPEDALPPMGPPRGEPAGITWKRAALGPPPPALMGRVMQRLDAHARECAGAAEGHVRLDVPVDLRRGVAGIRSTANLTGMLALDTVPTETPEAAVARMRRAIAAGRHLERVRGAAFLRHLPQWLVSAGAAQGARRHGAQTRFSTTAVVSNLGFVDTEDLVAPDFRTHRLFIVPPYAEVTPLFVMLTGGPAGVDLVLASPVRFASDGRLDALLEHLTAL
ncbi:MAG: hypothetical protein R3F61_23925 [Myxococcota bacterium]